VHTKSPLKKFLARLRNEEKGQDLTEYALLLAFVALVVIAIVKGLGSTVECVFSKASASLS